MGRFDYPEQWAVRQLRQAVLDSLMSHGEMCIFFQAYHSSIDTNAERCSCYDDIYKDKGGSSGCPKCYNTSFKDFKSVTRCWGLFTDSSNDEKHQKRGTWTSDDRTMQTEGLTILNSGDYVARVSYWDNDKPLAIEGIYVVGEVTVESLRTGVRYGQAPYDVVGQKARVRLLPEDHPIYTYDFNTSFDRPREGQGGNTY